MKRIVSIGLAAAVTVAIPLSVQAADIAMPPMYNGAPPPAYFSWTGCYIGTHSGLAAGHTTWRDSVPNGAIDATFSGQTANTDMSGAIYGAQLGCDYQFNGNWLVGIEGSVSRSTLTGTNMDQFNNTWSLRGKADWFGAVTGRVGVAVDRVLVIGAYRLREQQARDPEHRHFRRHAVDHAHQLDARLRHRDVVRPELTVFVEADYYCFGSANVSFVGDPINPTPPFTCKQANGRDACSG
jgi:hypothetical protein